MRRTSVFLEGMNVAQYEQGNRYNHDPVRSRESSCCIGGRSKLIGATERKGLTLIPRWSSTSRTGEPRWRSRWRVERNSTTSARI